MPPRSSCRPRSSLANPSTAMRLTDTDILDHSSSNDRENDSWPVESRKTESLIALTDHELSMDEYMLEAYSTDSDLDEPDPSEQQPAPDEQQQVPDEQQQEQQQQQQQQQQQEEQHIEFKMPKEPSPKKSKKAPVRRQKSRACKSTSKNYMADFSDDAELD